MALGATIAVNLAAIGVHMLTGENELLEFLLAHPLDMAAGHLTAHNIERLAERLHKWHAANEPIENEDLERAVTRCKVLADFLCLSDALAARPEGFGWLPPSLTRWWKTQRLDGVFSQAETAAVESGIANCRLQLANLEKGILPLVKIDSRSLVMPQSSAASSQELTARVLDELHAAHAGLPDRIDAIFRERWFTYLCLAFHEQIKTDPRVSRIFSAMQVATGLARLEDLVREDGEKTRHLVRQLALSTNASGDIQKPAKAHVTITQAKQQGIMLFSGEVSLVRIGRCPSSDVVLPQPASWEHGRIVLAGGTFTYEHLGKHPALIRRRNGKVVRLSNQRRSKEALRQLDEIIFTDTSSIRVQFSVPEEIGYTPTSSLSQSRSNEPRL